MDRTNNTGLYYDCMYYKVFDHITPYSFMEDDFKIWYEIISYCIRPFSESENIYNKVIEENILSQFTFEELRKNEITTRDLLLWSSSIDLVEDYDEYLSSLLNISSRFKKFYNCSSLWFGSLCQYTFNRSLSFDRIVNLTFNGKHSSYPSNITCYINLECNRGAAFACLDWREICDGKVDCIENDADEIDCFDLEINECEENEFRCHNGMCIPEEFLDEGPYYPDCFDGTDEDRYMITSDIINKNFFNCAKDPGYWCEETDSIKPARIFVCGDGDYSDEPLLYAPTSWATQNCGSLRDILMKKYLLSHIEHPDLSYDCWHFLYCSTVYSSELLCYKYCENDDDKNCFINVTDICQKNFVIFPQRPIIQGHVLLVYLTNKTIFFDENRASMFPDYVCYDIKKCPFLPTISILNINGTTCRSTNELNLHEPIDIIRFFQGCLIQNRTKLDLNHGISSTLFQCPGTMKYISKHRILDGIYDCYNGTDEINIDACQWNVKHRFRCSSENKCISHILVRNRLKDCLEGEDELPHIPEKISFQKFCNGYVHESPVLIDGMNETDETYCDNWPCNNLYTRCDGAWNCLNGADEVNCIQSKCPFNTHECVSPETKQIICLPIDRAGNGIVDCLGSTDERIHCRLERPTNFNMRYKCWNETFCIQSNTICLLYDSCFYHDIKNCSSDVKLVFNRLSDDRKLKHLDYEYFLLERNSIKSTSSIMNEENLKFSIQFSSYRIHICNRGILIYVKSQLETHCLCPPSYYGNRCQYQSQRISLTLQLSQICIPECYGIFSIIITLIDQDKNIYDHQQFTYMSTYKCDKKFFIYLLYNSRSKDMTKIYNIRIDAYNKIDMKYHSSWILPVKYLFLPVNRIAAHLIIPVNPVSSFNNCSRFCIHGQCYTYINNPNEYFCHCNSGWSGINCTNFDNCDCSLDSKCLGKIINQSICLCSLENYGPRCRIKFICQNDTCQNGGICVPDDERISRNTFVCLCSSKYSGQYCEIINLEIHISFNDIEIPRSLLVHFITVRIKADPIRTTISTKIPYDRDIAIIYRRISFHIIIIQILNKYYLGYVNTSYISSSLLTIQLESKQICPYVKELFNNKSLGEYPLIRRVKYYHLLCKEQSYLKCFHDNEQFLCLCNEERHANCFPFDFKTKYTCKGIGDCQNDAECFPDRPICPHSTFCVCKDCFYGSKCQFNTKDFSLSLDKIIGYEIRPRLGINQQPIIVKISIALTIIMLIIGLVNSILSIITFRRKILTKTACGQYLLITSIVSLCTTILFSIKFLMLILSQISIIENLIILRISCILIDFLLRLGPIIVDWINASVAIDRTLTVTMDAKYNKIKSRKAVRWVIIVILLISISSIIHDPIHRRIIYDEQEERRWCLVQYSSSLEIYNSIINICHFFIPFIINLLSAIIIIIVSARKRSTARQQQTYRQHLKKQFNQHKHLIISSIILVILATPRLIISFTKGCMKSNRNSSIYLAAYFISFIPPSLTFVVFILPSKLYIKELYTATQKFRTLIGR